MRKLIAIAGVVLSAIAAGSAPARSCGTGSEFAAVYLNADKALDSEDARFRCKFIMLGHMMCVGRNSLLARKNWRLVALALSDAWNGPDPRLRCAAARLQGEHLGAKSAKALSLPPRALDADGRKSLEQLTRSFGDWCTRAIALGVKADYSDLPLLGDGVKLADCLKPR